MKESLNSLKGIKVLVMGLGLHGGGVATVKWLLKQGAIVSATDKRDAKTLAPSLQALKGLPVRYTLGRHDAGDFRTNDLIVVNPAVPRESEYLAIARKAHKRIENDTSLFFAVNTTSTIAITGTRGKTSTTLFLAELLKKKYKDVKPSGNTPENALLKEYSRRKKKDTPVVCELSSWQLEHLHASGKAPHIAIITNLFPDHLNRYKDMNAYADAKANIFLLQTAQDYLILNKQNIWTTYFLKKKPKSQIFFISTTPLKKGEQGLFVHHQNLIFRKNGEEKSVLSIMKFISERGVHNLENLMCALLATLLIEKKIKVTERDILRLSSPPMRQEIIYKKGSIIIVNDSCATSPDGTIVALERFGKPKISSSCLIAIIGGTDKELEFSNLARVLKKYSQTTDIIFLEGSATTRLQKKLNNDKFQQETFNTLEKCVKAAKQKSLEVKGQVTILFSPGAASFEKFLHEFDRGKKFTALVKKYFH